METEEKDRYQNSQYGEEEPVMPVLVSKKIQMKWHRGRQKKIYVLRDKKCISPL